ncbi:MAG: NnrS family protein [Alphaproteobacteria bacterium]|nr:NnrS family protein [Alphaproteobacteria bacterium]
MKRNLLIFRPAGVFFALAAMVAAILPWLWLLPLADPGQAHVRLGIFGFGGMTVSGYLLTAQRAWTGAEAPLPILGLAALALGARMLALAEPQSTWLVCLPLLVVALAILLPVLYARRWDKAPLALVPLGLVIAEGALVRQQISAAALPQAMGALILPVGGRMITAFLIEERRRSSHIRQSPQGQSAAQVVCRAWGRTAVRECRCRESAARFPADCRSAARAVLVRAGLRAVVHWPFTLSSNPQRPRMAGVADEPNIKIIQ